MNKFEPETHYLIIERLAWFYKPQVHVDLARSFLWHDDLGLGKSLQCLMSKFDDVGNKGGGDSLLNEAVGFDFLTN